MLEVNIIDVTDDTVEDLCNLAEAYYAQLARMDPVFELRPDWRTTYAELIRRGIGRENYWIRMAHRDAVPIGFILFGYSEEPIWVVPHRGMIWDLFVLSAWRRRAVGRALVDNAVSTLRQAGAQRIDLSALHANPAALRFWEQLGFRAFMSRMTRSGIEGP